MTAFNVCLHLITGWVRANLKDPIGGVAYGIPRNTSILFPNTSKYNPSTLPDVVDTIGPLNSSFSMFLNEKLEDGLGGEEEEVALLPSLEISFASNSTNPT